MSDEFQTYREGLSDPADNHFAITPSDATDFDFVTRGIYVGTGGDIAIVAKDGTVVVWVGVPDGAVIPFRAARINATATTASNLVGLH